MLLSITILFVSKNVLKAFHRDEIANKFHNVTEQIETALVEIPYKKFAISDEVREQVILQAYKIG